MGDVNLARDIGGLAASPGLAGGPTDRTRAMLDAHFAFIWRLLRRLGVPESDIDDAVQRVFIVATGKAERIAASSERSFLFGTALRIASSFRRTARRRREVSDELLATEATRTLSADEAIEHRQQVAILDQIIDGMPDELREVFVLCEIEELSVSYVATLQSIPVGTASSRLRRARKEFQDAAKRVLVSRKRREGGP